MLYFMMPRPCPTAGHERTKSKGKASSGASGASLEAPERRRKVHMFAMHFTWKPLKVKPSFGYFSIRVRFLLNSVMWNCRKNSHGGYKAGTQWMCRAKGRDTADTRQIHRRHGRQGLGARRGQGGPKADARRTSADTRQTHCGRMAGKVWGRGKSGHKADTWQTSSRDAARAYRGQPFFPKTEPHSKLLGEKTC